VAQVMATHQAVMQQWAVMQQSQMTAHMQACMQAFQSGLPMPRLL
jgi:ethanolamine ammonia-lyase large subunit